jgi:hypothetical protein
MTSQVMDHPARTPASYLGSPGLTPIVPRPGSRELRAARLTCQNGTGNGSQVLLSPPPPGGGFARDNVICLSAPVVVLYLLRRVRRTLCERLRSNAYLYAARRPSFHPAPSFGGGGWGLL